MADIYVAGDNPPIPPNKLDMLEKNRRSGEVLRGKEYLQKLIPDILNKSGEVVKKELNGAYEVCPKTRFINEQSDEEVILLLRAHPITNLKWIFISIFVLLLPELFIGVGMFAAFPFKVVLLTRLIWYLWVVGYAFEKFLTWFFSVLIVTNERVVDIDFENLLYRVMSYVNLNHIEEPTMVSGGFIRSFFKFGDISVATAAESTTVEGLAIPYPDKVIRIISELSEELEKRRELGE